MTDVRHRGGFTLVEMLVVLGIVAMLAGIVTVVTLRVDSQAKEGALANIFTVIKGALREYFEFTGGFPAQPVRDSANAAAHMELMYRELDLVPASREILKGVNGTLVKDYKKQPDVPKIYDPWGTVLDYVYTPGSKGDTFPELISAGPDRKFGTGDDFSSKGK